MGHVRAGANVIVQVVTRPATEQDIDALDLIHAGLTSQGFQPAEHVVDGGCTSVDSIREQEPTSPASANAPTVNTAPAHRSTGSANG